MAGALEKTAITVSRSGKSERSVFRVVLEDNSGKYFLLEQILPKSLEHKKQIARLLDFLAKKKSRTRSNRI